MNTYKCNYLLKFFFIYLVEFILEAPDLRYEFPLKLICSCLYVVGGQISGQYFFSRILRLSNRLSIKNRFYLDIKTPPRKTFEEIMVHKVFIFILIKFWHIGGNKAERFDTCARFV